MPDGPLLVFGPRSTTYDFGPYHPLTPRRFGPGIDLLRAVGAEPGLAPEPAPDADLERVHTARYLAAVKRLSADPEADPEAGIGPGDDPPFPGMHEAGAAVAGGSIRATEAILRGEIAHAFHPGGGLHHAMADRASGFCIYDDPALAVAWARDAGRRVLYLDFDVHHGDGVQAIHLADPGVLTLSVHESGRYLFPGTGFVGELGRGDAAGTSVNVPLEPPAGERAWREIVERLVPAVAAAFGPSFLVTQHGADSHAWDPLAHLRVTTTAMGAAARLADRIAHRYTKDGSWLSTGGGGYDAYRVVPRSWSLVWLAGAHRDSPERTPVEWRERWAAEAQRFDQAPLPEAFVDEPNAGLPRSDLQSDAERRSLEVLALVRRLVLPTIVRAAEDAGWWSAIDELDRPRTPEADDEPPAAAEPTLVPIDAASLEGLRVVHGVLPVAGAGVSTSILQSAARAGVSIVGAVAGDRLVGVSLAHEGRLLGLGVAPRRRRRGLGRALLGRLVRTVDGPLVAEAGLGERDPVKPLAVETRARIARSLLEGAGFRVTPAPDPVGRHDGTALIGRR
jgi:acetoin utilization protein AcuC